MESNLIQQQIERTQEELQFFANQKMEIHTLIETVNVMDKDKKLRAPVGGGIYFDSKITSNKFILNVGAGNFVEKNKKELLEILAERIIDIEKIEKEKFNELQEFNRKIIDFQKKLKAENSKK